MPTNVPAQTGKVTQTEHVPATYDAPAANNGIPPKPDHVPAKFYDAKTGKVDYEAMSHSYAELEKKLGGGSDKPTDQQQPKPDQKPTDKKDDTADLKVQQAVTYGAAIDGVLEKAGLTPGGVDGEWRQNKKLSDETYSKLEKAGFTRAVVDQYIRGAVAAEQASEAENKVAEQTVTSLKAIAGGDDGFAAMQQWAAQSLKPSEIKAFNDALEGGPAMAEIAIRGLYSRYSDAVGTEPNLVTGGGRGGTDIFTSAEAAADAMAEARASGDPARIRSVEQKMLRSSVFG
jgi:hypothetical protein